MTLTSAGLLTPEQEHARAKENAIREMEDREKAKLTPPEPNSAKKPPSKKEK